MTARSSAITLALTGASGIQYGMRLLECLLQANKTVYFLLSNAAELVAAMETDWQLPHQAAQLQNYLQQHFAHLPGQVHVFGQQQWTAPIASGSACAEAMVICPCSSGCLAAIASGASNNLIERAADVMLKERKKLILVHRETPLSAIHLENLLKLAQLGAIILPANPGFYQKPSKVDDLIDFIVARVLDHLGVQQELLPRWGD